MNKFILGLLVFCFITTFPLYTQEPQASVPLTQAIDDGVRILASRIRTGTMIVVFGIQSPTHELSNFITAGILDHLVSKDEMKIVDRQNPDLIAKEHEIQLSGNVNDEYIQGIGHQFGAEVIITGSLTLEGEIYQLRLQALNVRTAQVMGRTSSNIAMDTNLAVLLRINWKDPNAWKQKRWYIGVRGGSDLNLFKLGSDVTTSHASYGDIPRPLFAEISAPFHFSGAFEVGVQITRFFGIQVEMMYTRETIEMYANNADIRYINIYGTEGLTNIFGFFSGGSGSWPQYVHSPKAVFTTDILDIPILAKFTVRPSIFELSLLAGAYLTIPLSPISFEFSGTALSAYIWQDQIFFAPSSDFTVQQKLDWAFPSGGLMAGTNFGIKLGLGVLFADVRFMMDFAPIKNKESEDFFISHPSFFNTEFPVKMVSKELFERRKITFSLGYRIGIGNIR
jgi:hypothetical protein